MTKKMTKKIKNAVSQSCVERNGTDCVSQYAHSNNLPKTQCACLCQADSRVQTLIETLSAPQAPRTGATCIQSY